MDCVFEWAIPECRWDANPANMLRVGKYDWKTKHQPSTPGFRNVLIHTTGTLSPYVMKSNSGEIMENIWQFSKIWAQVPPVKQNISRYSSDIRWTHPAEIHWDDQAGEPTPAYWAWRAKGMAHRHWVRYPCGFRHHSKAMGSIVGNPDSWTLIDYIDARKRIYYPVYRQIAIKTRRFRSLLSTYQRGENIQINEVDGPRLHKEQPYCQVVNGSLPIDHTILDALINNPQQAFGHGYALAAAIIEWEPTCV
jgi:hypothetical protein